MLDPRDRRFVAALCVAVVASVPRASWVEVPE